MTGDTLSILGGIGLFLFGMRTMTEALRKLGGRRLRALLARFTRTPFTGAVAGAVATAAVQSSSATILIVIGFVGAGLMGFPQALGVVMGANVGTTVTGWMVAILGLKLNLGALALPLLFVASLALLLSRDRIGRIGEASAGFAMVFLGLDMMRKAAAGIEPMLVPVLADADTIMGRLALVGLGAAVTAVIQSSGAGVAAVLVLFSGGAIDLLQAGALVIGMDIGTGAKTLLVTVGKPVDARRTAYANVAFNLSTALFAFAGIGLLPVLARATGDGATAVTAFYSLFNVTGALLALPFVGPLARFFVWLVPGPEGLLPAPPDPDLLEEPLSALDAARVATDGIAAAIASDIARRLSGADPLVDPDALLRATEEVERFVLRIEVPPGREGPANRAAALMHRIDHLNRLLGRLAQTDRIALVRDEALLAGVRAPLRLSVNRVARGAWDGMAADRLSALARQVGRRARLIRQRLMTERPPDDDGFPGAFAVTDALRWAERVAAHLERVAHYGAVARAEAPTRAEARHEASED